QKFNKVLLIITECLIVILLLVGAYLSFNFRYDNYGGVINSCKIISKNPKLLPKSTVKLGQNLEKLHKEKNDHLYVLTPDWVKVDKYDHSLAVLLRQYSPSSSIISAIPRYHDFDNKEFKGFKQEDDDLYKDYLGDYKSNYNKFKAMLNKYPINCLVTEKINSKESIESLGFKYETKSCANNKCYYIYYKTTK
ncbi:MAG: hypothetical protein IJH34_02220, partial [Romboutsia sp.]|nr:hypothetical protein [Romboutsia sp.]